jgi:hypothetical protein
VHSEEGESRESAWWRTDASEGDRKGRGEEPEVEVRSFVLDKFKWMP